VTVHHSSRLATVALALMLLSPVGAAAQQPAATLTLDDAIRLARINNPGYLARTTDARDADWAVRSAYASLLPGATVSTTFGYQGSGTPRFGSFTGGDFGLARTPGYLTSGYTIGLNYQLSGATVLAPTREQASRRAVMAGIEAAAFNLDALVTRQYLAVLQAQDGLTLAQQELERARDVRRLAAARVAVGEAIPLEAMQAEVQEGRAEVALLQAQNQVDTERLRLIETLGIDIDDELVLTSTFVVEPLPWTQDDLLAAAVASHPQLRAARAVRDASDTGVRIARSAYLPTLNMSAGRTGFARQATDSDFLINQARRQSAEAQQSCGLLNLISAGLSSPLPNTPADCSVFALTADMEAQIRASNNVFPFNYTRDPFTLNVQISLPIFQGLQRERQLEAARVAAQDARHNLRAEELRLRTEVATAYRTAQTALRSVQLEERNRALASARRHFSTCRKPRRSRRAPTART
jgi:outer membrane protein TolC